ALPLRLQDDASVRRTDPLHHRRQRAHRRCDQSAVREEVSVLDQRRRRRRNRQALSANRRRLAVRLDRTSRLMVAGLGCVALEAIRQEDRRAEPWRWQTQAARRCAGLLCEGEGAIGAAAPLLRYIRFPKKEARVPLVFKKDEGTPSPFIL